MGLLEILIGIPAASRALRSVLMALGLMCVVLGLTILFVPQILVFLVSGLFLFAGLALLGVAWRLRPARRPFQTGHRPDVIDELR